MASGSRNFRDGLTIYQIAVAIEHHLQPWTQPAANYDCIAFNRADLHGLHVNPRTALLIPQNEDGISAAGIVAYQRRKR
jgi:hypothetical protein